MQEPTRVRIVVVSVVGLLTSVAILLADAQLARQSARLAGEMVLLQRGRQLDSRIRAPEQVTADGREGTRLSWTDVFEGIVYVARIDGDRVVQGVDRLHIEYAFGWRDLVKGARAIAVVAGAMLLWTLARGRPPPSELSS